MFFLMTSQFGNYHLEFFTLGKKEIDTKIMCFTLDHPIEEEKEIRNINFRISNACESHNNNVCELSDEHKNNIVDNVSAVCTV